MHVFGQTIPNLQEGRLAHAMTITSEFAADWDGPYHHPEHSDLIELNTKARCSTSCRGTI
jgi:hypothetical protein